jgi:uncharacterized protein with ParB-like and HNH nuclease domain
MHKDPISIVDAVNLIREKKLYLPAIQRNFVWSKDKIEYYFDSMFRGYPIGSFIFWKLTRTTAKKYPFYQFIEYYHERDTKFNQPVPRNVFPSKLWGVLDGQQRLTAIFLGLTGSCTYKKKGRGHWEKDWNFEEKMLHINLLASKKLLKDKNLKYQIEFITYDKAEKVDINNLWVEVGESLSWESTDDIHHFLKDYIDELRADGQIKPSIIEKIDKSFNNSFSVLEDIYNKVREPILSYYEVLGSDIDEVLEIFVRVNSGGMILSKSQLLFSTLIAQWPEGREKVEGLINKLSNIGLWVDVNLIMRACLTLSDLPVLFKVKSFKTENVDKVIRNWDLVDDSLIKTAELIHELGYTDQHLRSKNSLIPIAYYISKGGDTRSSIVRRNLQKYFVVSQIKGVFGTQGDSVLNKVRDILIIDNGYDVPQLKSNRFDYNCLHDIRFSGDKSYKITEDFIEEELLELKKGLDSLLLLSLLYQQIDFERNHFEMDHIHPDSKFKQRYLSSIGIQDQEIVEDWQDKKDKIANLQLLVTKRNRTKLATPLDKWLDLLEKETRGAKNEFIKDNFLPRLRDYSLNNFDNFYKRRRKILKTKLINLLID